MKSRVFQFLLKSGRSLRATVYYSRGFLRSARVLGTVNFQLNDLAHSVTFMTVGDLMDGRKAIGGRVQLRVRQRSATASPQITSCSKPWLVLTLSKPKNDPVLSARQNTHSPEHHSLHCDGPLDMRKRSSPHSISFPAANQQQQNNHSQKQTLVGLKSLAVLKEDRRHLEKRLAEPDLQAEKRRRYELEQKQVDHWIRELKSRLEGKDSAAEIKLYMGELHALIKQTQQRYEKYSAQNDSRSAEHCEYQLRIMKKELEDYIKSYQPKY